MTGRGTEGAEIHGWVSAPFRLMANERGTWSSFESPAMHDSVSV